MSNSARAYKSSIAISLVSTILLDILSFRQQIMIPHIPLIHKIKSILMSYLCKRNNIVMVCDKLISILFPYFYLSIRLLSSSIASCKIQRFLATQIQHSIYFQYIYYKYKFVLFTYSRKERSSYFYGIMLRIIFNIIALFYRG